MRKVFVNVIVNYNKEGLLMPDSFIWENGEKYDIDKVIDYKKAPSLAVGGQGIKYKCRVRNKEISLFLEEDKWFIEGK